MFGFKHLSNLVKLLEGFTQEQAKGIKLGIFCYFFYTSVKIIDARIERQLSTDKTDLPDKFLTLEYNFATGTTQWLHAPTLIRYGCRSNLF